MTLEARLNTAFNGIGVDVGQLQNWINGQSADLSGLNTTAKSNLVSAINEVVAEVNSATNISDGTTSSSSTWSSTKISTEISGALSTLLGGAPATLDTLNELAAAIADDEDFSATVTALISEKVSYTSAQTLTTAQKLQACENIGIGDPEASFLSAYTTARDT